MREKEQGGGQLQKVGLGAYFGSGDGPLHDVSLEAKDEEFTVLSWAASGCGARHFE